MSNRMFSETISIDQFVQPKTIARFIGSKGKSLLSFEKASHVKAVIVTQGGNIRFRSNGSYENVEKSFFKFYGNIAELEDSLQFYTMEIPNKKIGFLIGTHGWSLNEIMHLSGAKLFSKPGKQEMSILVIEGSHSKTLMAIELVLRRLERFDSIDQQNDERYISHLSRKIASGEENV